MKTLPLPPSADVDLVIHANYKKENSGVHCTLTIENEDVEFPEVHFNQNTISTHDQNPLGFTKEVL